MSMAYPVSTFMIISALFHSIPAQTCASKAPAIVGAYYLFRRVHSLRDRHQIPHEELPPISPMPGYKFFAFMGCPKSKVEAIQQRQRNLFFTQDISLAEFYALERTSRFSQIFRNDQPVVLQIEILANETIQEKDLWRDRLLNDPPTFHPRFISFHPAVSPEAQQRCDLQVRIHHVVAQNKSHLQKIVEFAYKKFSLSNEEIVPYLFLT